MLEARAMERRANEDTAAAQRDPSKMSYEDYKKWRTGSR
jgi:hypothetical protein